MRASCTASRKLALGVVSLAGVAAMPMVAQAGVTLVSADRRIVADTAFTDEVVRSTSGFGTFNETVSASFDDPQDTDRTSGRASQVSSVGADRLGASGFLEINNLGESSGVAARYSVVFDVTQDTTFDLTYSLNTASTNLLPQTENGRVELRRLNDGGEFVVGPDLLSLGSGDDAAGPQPANSFDGEGVLAPGQYQLLLDVDAPFDSPGFNDGTKFRVEYALDLQLGEGDGGGTPNPIPLPPAAFAGGAVMLGMGARRTLRRYRWA